MFSRSTAFALAFACLATLSVAVTAKVQRAELDRPSPVTQTMRVIDLPRVVITAQRIKSDAAI